MMMMLMPRTPMLMTTAAIPMSLMTVPVFPAVIVSTACSPMPVPMLLPGPVSMLMIMPAADHAPAHEKIEDSHHREGQSAHESKDFESALQVRHVGGRPSIRPLAMK